MLRNISTVLLGNLATFLLGNLMTFLFWNIMAFLLVTNLLTNPLVDGVAFLSVAGVTLLLVRGVTFTSVLSLINRNEYVRIKRSKHQSSYPALFLWNLVALSVVDNLTILVRNIFADLVMDILAFLLVGYLAVSNEIGNTLPLHHRLTFVLKLYGTLCIILSGTLFCMGSFLDILGKLETLKLGSTVAFFILNLRTLLLDVLDVLTLLPVLDGTDPLVGELLDRSLSDGTSFLLSLGTDFVRNITTLLPGNRLVGLLRDLRAYFLGNLLTRLLRYRWRTCKRRMGCMWRT